MFSKFLLALKRNAIGRYWLNNRVAIIRSGIAKGFLRRGGLGILGIFQKKETPETRFIRSLELKGKTIYDIGANFGAFTLFFASRAGPKGKVMAFDPIPENCQAIETNLLLNKLRERVTVFCKGVGSAYGKLQLTYQPGNTSTASFENGCSDALKANGDTACLESEIVPLDDFVIKNNLPLPSLVKIDVEGYEFEVLKGMERLLNTTKPNLFIELHGSGSEAKRKIAEQVILLLLGKNYCITHVESGQRLSDNVVSSGHLYCTPN